MRETGNLATSVAKQLVKDKAEMLLGGKGSRDVFSLLRGSSFSTASFRSWPSNYSIVKANMDTDAKAKLTDVELFAQMRWVRSVCRNRTVFRSRIVNITQYYPLRRS
jgi:hypothetical protein